MINAKHDSLTGMTKDLYNVNKIVKNTLGNNEINVKYKPTHYIHQYLYCSTFGCVFLDVMYFSIQAPSHQMLRWYSYFIVLLRVYWLVATYLI